MKSLNRSRRSFIRFTGAGVGGLLAAPLISSNAYSQSLQDFSGSPLYPDQIVINAKVYTVDSTLPQAEAFAIAADKFSAVGSTA